MRKGSRGTEEKSRKAAAGSSGLKGQGGKCEAVSNEAETEAFLPWKKRGGRASERGSETGRRSGRDSGSGQKGTGGMQEKPGRGAEGSGSSEKSRPCRRKLTRERLWSRKS